MKLKMAKLLSTNTIIIMFIKKKNSHDRWQYDIILKFDND